MWDLCCDHGHLGVAAYKSGAFPEVCFVDPVPTIIERLEELFRKYSLKESTTKVSFFCVAGEDLPQAVSGTLVATGVGGHTIVSILQGLQQKGLLQADTLILGPHKDEELVERHLTNFSTEPVYKCSKTLKITERGRERLIYIYQR